MNRVKIVTLLVHYQDVALDFYTRKLRSTVTGDSCGLG
jgi:hypothetical protein